MRETSRVLFRAERPLRAPRKSRPGRAGDPTHLDMRHMSFITPWYASIAAFVVTTLSQSPPKAVARKASAQYFSFGAHSLRQGRRHRIRHE